MILLKSGKGRFRLADVAVNAFFLSNYKGMHVLLNGGQKMHLPQHNVSFSFHL